jgi:hypothetical protein
VNLHVTKKNEREKLYPCESLGQSPAGNNVTTETQNIVGIHNQATTSKDIAAWEDPELSVVNS